MAEGCSSLQSFKHLLPQDSLEEKCLLNSIRQRNLQFLKNISVITKDVQHEGNCPKIVNQMYRLLFIRLLYIRYRYMLVLMSDLFVFQKDDRTCFRGFLLVLTLSDN